MLIEQVLKRLNKRKTRKSMTTGHQSDNNTLSTYMDESRIAEEDGTEETDGIKSSLRALRKE